MVSPHLKTIFSVSGMCRAAEDQLIVVITLSLVSTIGCGQDIKNHALVVVPASKQNQSPHNVDTSFQDSRQLVFEGFQDIIDQDELDQLAILFL